MFSTEVKQFNTYPYESTVLFCKCFPNNPQGKRKTSKTDQTCHNCACKQTTALRGLSSKAPKSEMTVLIGISCSCIIATPGCYGDQTD